MREKYVTHDTTRHLHLSGTRLWIARVLWSVVVIITVLVTIIGVRNFPDYVRRGSVGMFIECSVTPAQITEVTPGGPAYNANLKSGDGVLAIDGATLTEESCASLVTANPGYLGQTSVFTIQKPNGTVEDYPLVRATARTEMTRWLLALGVSLDNAVPFVVIFEFSSLLIFWILGFIVALRRSDDAMAVFTSALLIAGGIRFSGMVYAAEGDFPVQAFISVNAVFIVLFFAIFPDGRFVPRAAFWIWVAYTITAVNYLFNVIPIVNLYFEMIDLGLLVLVTATQVYRYFQGASPSQRQQTKWIVFGFVVGVTGFYLFRIFSLFGIVLPPEFGVVTILFTRTATLLVPLAIGLAVMRYRLFDIDLVINRSITYGAVTVLLVAVFILGALVLQRIIGEANSGIAFALSAVGAGVLFNPAKKKLQNFVDRRLYGFRFDLYELRRAQKAHDVKKSGAFTGQKIGGYHVLDVIGKGGMGEVYRATNDKNEVAMKILPEIFAIQEEPRLRFEREAEALTTLHHHNIVRTYKSGISDGTYYIAMELIEGQQLEEAIRTRGAMDLEDTRQIIADLAAALDYAHSGGLVHRDIKPSNVMIRLKADNETPEAVLMDFGIAKIHDAHTGLTGTGAVGTIDYMAPEQIMAAKEVDKRADVYALGIVAYEMLTGERPFKGNSAQVLFAHLQQPPPDVRDSKTELPREVARAIQKAMEKKPEDRFPSAGEFASALQ